MSLLDAAAPFDEEDPGLLLPDEIRRLVPERAVLVLVFNGCWTDGDATTYTLVCTREREFFDAGGEGVPYGDYFISGDGRRVGLSPMGIAVAEQRQDLQRDPRPREVSREVAQHLAGDAERYFRPVLQHLAELRAAGKDHLLVVPHGPVHFAPLHLALSEGRPLAENWAVSYLYNLAQLVPRAVPGRVRPQRRIAAFGVTYEGRPGFAALQDSAAEATAVAAVFGARPLLDEQATVSAFVQAAPETRYLHIRAHGRHNVGAPLFQTVFLSPSDGDDGRLCAHDVLRMDLSGVELITLSACETALGRVDRSDNPRGLPAAFLLAGARAVIGTLWPVLTEASTLFFTELYRVLEADQQPIPYAFAAAQRVTRRRFPAYRDWGTFFLIGGVAPVTD